MLKLLASIFRVFAVEQGIAPGSARRYAPAAADGNSTVAKIAADLRPSADGRNPHISGGRR